MAARTVGAFMALILSGTATPPTPTFPPLGPEIAAVRESIEQQGLDSPQGTPSGTAGGQVGPGRYDGLLDECQAVMLEIAGGADPVVPTGCEPCIAAGEALRPRVLGIADETARRTVADPSGSDPMTGFEWSRLDDWEREAIRASRPRIARRLDAADKAERQAPDVFGACERASAR